MALAAGDCTDGNRSGLAGHIADLLGLSCPRNSLKARGLNNLAKAVADGYGGGGGGGGSGVPIPDRAWGMFWSNNTIVIGQAGLSPMTSVAPGANGVIAGTVITGYQSSNAAGVSAGLQGPFDMFLIGLGTGRGPKLSVKILMAEAANNTTRWWMGFSNTNLGVITPTIAPVASTALYVAWVADVNISPNWILASGDGTTHSGIDSGLAIDMVGTAGGRAYVLTLDWTANGSLVGTAKRSDGTGATMTITKTTNLAAIGAGNGKIGPWMGGVNLNGAAHNFWIARGTFEGENDAR